MLEDVIKKWGGVEVSAMEVYTDMFALGSGFIQNRNEPKGEYKANPLGYWKNNDCEKGHYRIMFEDTFEETLTELQEADFAIINGISYFGRKNVQEHASKMYAMIFDLDGVSDKTMSNFLSGCSAEQYDIYPMPNYIVLSGHGIHLYYILEEPVPLYPNIKLQLKQLKYALTGKMWNRYTSEEWKNVQYQGINQGFRVIGGKTKIPGVRTRAFMLNSHPYNLEYLNRFVEEKDRIDTTKLWKESKLTLAEAKKKYPEWYEKRVVRGEPRGNWKCKIDLYNWWKRRIQEGAAVGHRYFCLMCLAIYAVKCGVSYEELFEDTMNLIPFMNLIGPGDEFTVADARSALECYDERYITFPIEDLSKISGIPIKKNRRNGRKQAVHLRIARTIQDINDQVNNTNWREGNGRPSKEELIKEYIANNPHAKVAQIARELEVSRTTVYKYMEQ